MKKNNISEMPQIFIAPRSGEQSSKNFQKTIEGGYKKSDLIKFFSEEDKNSLKGQEILMIWGNKPSLKSRWEKMKKGDWVLFYQNGFITYVGKLLHKTHNKKLADELWGFQNNKKGTSVSWEYVFFLTDLKPVNIPYKVMADLAEYKGSVVQGFLPYSSKGIENITKKDGSIENFFNKYLNKKEINKVNIKNIDKNILEIAKVETKKSNQIKKPGLLINFKKQKNMDMLNFRAVDKELREVLYGRDKYKIPRYQRPYSWTIDQVSDLWIDLVSGETAFLGSFVFNYERYDQDGFVEVIDGQQRLITLTILMAVIRDKYKELGEGEKALLTQGIIANKDPISAKEESRLRCGDSLNSFFSEHIQQKDSNILIAKPRTKEEKTIKSNYEFIRDQINDGLDSSNDLNKKIEYLDALKARVFGLKIILISIENEEDAYSIFETVNARGADLTAADLLKNYIFGKLPKKNDREDFAKEVWTSIESNVESARGPLNVSKFIRYFWISKYSFVPEKRLYREVKKEIDNPVQFLNDLQRASGYYYKMASDSTVVADWLEDFSDKKIAQRITETMSSLRIMGITQCYSLLLCLLMNKDKIGYDFSEIFKVIERYHFAYSAVCKLSGNVVERIYFNTAKEIREALNSYSQENIIKNVQRILAQFKNNLYYPNRALFIEKFSDIDYKSYPLVIYVLSNIEKALSKTEEKILNFTKINIEHILPQEPSQWSLTKKEIKGHVNMLGNLTLIDKKINGPMGNKKLKEKMSEFANSELAMNKKLVKEFEILNYKWGEEDIKDRQNELAEFAYDTVWKF